MKAIGLGQRYNSVKFYIKSHFAILPVKNDESTYQEISTKVLIVLLLAS